MVYLYSDTGKQFAKMQSKSVFISWHVSVMRLLKLQRLYIYHIDENQMTKCVLEKRAIQKTFIKITRKHQ